MIIRKKEKKRKNNPLTPLNQSQQILFNSLWNAYPKRKAKGRAEKAFLKADPDELLVARMEATIKKAKTSEDWTRENGKYIPLPATWLNDRRWEDEIENSGSDNNGERPAKICQKCEEPCKETVQYREMQICENCFRKINPDIDPRIKEMISSISHENQV